MKITDVLTTYRFPEAAQAIYRDSGISELFPPQEAAIRQGLLNGDHFLLSFPTAAGKTLLAELCMLKSYFSHRGRCLYIVPLKALAHEKYESFKTRFAPLDIKVGLATGDVDTPQSNYSGYHILVATAEKVDSLLRSRTQWLLNRLRVIVLDEIHFLNDSERGPTLEILAARFKGLNPQLQILALSATVSNGRQIANWLNAKMVQSTWRPVPLKEGIYLQDHIHFSDLTSHSLREKTKSDLGNLCLDTVRAQGQVLVFVNSRRSAQAASRQVARHVAPLLNPKERTQLQNLSQQLLGSATESTKVCQRLAEVTSKGVAFHHAGLKPKQRQLLEENFKNNLIKVLCATPTLATGVNLPARRAIIRDVKRFEHGYGSSFIPVSEYKQCAGRAGRPHMDPYGEAVIMAKTQAESKSLLNRYIKSPPEPITSQLGNETALRSHILASIVGGYVHDLNDTFSFMSQTFLSHQKRATHLIEGIGQIFDFLLEEGFIEKRGFKFYATPFGQYTSRLYIDPASSIIIRAGLDKISEGASFSHVGLLHMMCCCPDCPLIRFGKKDLEDINLFTDNYQDELILSAKDLPMLEDFSLAMAITKTTFMLSRWIDEEREEQLCDQFHIGPGDIYRHIESIRWLLHAGLTFAELFGHKKMTCLLAKLKKRVQYGIKEQLLSLVNIRGVGRVRARQLYGQGYRQVSDLKGCSEDDLARVEKIGPKLARDILLQVLNPPNKMSSPR